MDNIKQIHIITRSPEQYENLDYSISEDVGDLDFYRFPCVVLDDMLDTSQKLIDPFFTRERHHDCDVSYLSQS